MLELIKRGDEAMKIIIEAPPKSNEADRTVKLAFLETLKPIVENARDEWVRLIGKDHVYHHIVNLITLLSEQQEDLNKLFTGEDK